MSVLKRFVQDLDQHLGKDSPQVKEARKELYKQTRLATGVQRDSGRA